MPRHLSDWQLLALALLPAILLRAALVHSQSGVLWPDSFAYLEWALNIAFDGQFSSYPAYRTPGYSLFLAGVFSLSGLNAAGFAAMLAQHLLGILTLAALYFLSRNIYSQRTAFLSTLLFGIHPLQLYYEHVYQTEALFVFLLVFTLFLSVRCMKTSSPRRLLILAIVTSALTLTRPIGRLLAVLIAVCIVMAQARSKGWKRATGEACYYLLLFALFLVPWMIFNKLNHNALTISQDFGLNLYHRVIDIQRLPLPRKTNYPIVRKLAVHERRRPESTYFWVYNALRRREHSAVEADKHMGAYAWEVFKKRPQKYLRYSLQIASDLLFDPRVSRAVCPGSNGESVLCCPRRPDLSFGQFLPPTSVPADSAFQIGVRNFTAKYIGNMPVPFSIVLAFSLMTLFGIRHTKRLQDFAPHFLLIGTIAYFVGVTSLLNWPEDRFRLPIDPLFLLYGSAGITLCIDKFIAVTHPKKYHDIAP